ncbi:Serine/threonine-protein kinase MRCK gamma [Rhizoctonia solani]|uniref:Serine/threonine-protein kinase MRCK gamma n=1 Tax=Rhizoctonia solani TaxID=456999 RepID=A0A0K6G083_9AGAM|nr:Serine/threonine-protein kinase MRCK gamma [Rhizoctonia solani]
MQRELDKINESIGLLSHLLPLAPRGSRDLRFLLARLADAHDQRFDILGEPKDIEKALEYMAGVRTLTPDNADDMPSVLSALGMARGKRYQRLRDPADMEKGIELQSLALSMMSNNDPDLAELLSNLSVSHKDRYDRFGELRDIEKAIEYNSRAVALTPEGNPTLSRHFEQLGSSNSLRFQRLGRVNDLEDAIKFQSRALSLAPDGYPHLPQILTNLGISHSSRFQRLGELGDLDKAIEYKTRALALSPNSHPDLPTYLNNLGASYRDRFSRLGELDDLEKTIDYQARAVASTPDGHPDLSLFLNNLGLSHRFRYDRLGELNDLGKGIELQTRALALTPDGHSELSSRFGNLGASHNHRYHRLGDLDDLEKAIEYGVRAVALVPNDHPDLANCLDNLGASYNYRFERLGGLEDLEKAIESTTRALALTPDNHPKLSSRLANLGTSHRNRFDCLRKSDDIEKVITYQTRAVDLIPHGHPDLSNALAKLGTAHSYRFQYLGQQDALEKAIECYTRAVALTPDGHTHLPRHLANLATMHSNRFKLLGSIQDLEKAIANETCALAAISDDHPSSCVLHFNHAVSHFRYYEHSSDISYLDKSLTLIRAACNLWAGPPRDRFGYAQQWAAIATEHDSFNPIEAFQTTIDLLPQFIWLGAPADQRYDDLKMVETLGVDAACVAIISSNYALALEWLEHARCILWNQNLMLRSPLDQLRAIDPSLATQLQTIAVQLHTAGFNSRKMPKTSGSSTSMTQEEVGQWHRRLAREYDQLLTQSRTLSGFEDFLRPMKVNALVRAAQNGPIVVLNCHVSRCDALLVLPNQTTIDHLPLPKFNEIIARSIRSQIYMSGGRQGFEERGVHVRRKSESLNNLASMLATLWHDVVKPILDVLGHTDHVPTENMPHITWCPTGAMSFLPLHAAGDYDQPHSRVFDYVISSYTPTLAALLTSTPSKLCSDSRVLAIGQGVTPGHQALPGAAKELGYVRSHVESKFGYTQLLDTQATPSTVLDAMETHDWVHLACHAHQNVTDPTKSGFFLHGGTLDLASINRRTFKKKGLAFLSACQTATGDEKLPDEAVHLASGMLMAGYSGVIATMWSVDDRDAPFVANKVYNELMVDGKLGNGEAGRALHNAVAGLRERVGEKAFGRWVPYIHFGS